MYFDRLYTFIYHSVQRDQAAAEDIIQNVFISALKSAKGFKGQSKIYTWLASIAHHKIIDYYRREQRELYHNNYATNNDPYDLQTIADNSKPILENLESNEMGEDVSKALLSLPLDYQQVLLFKYVEEMTVLEISQVMNRSPKSIEGLITRARRLFKENFPVKSQGETILQKD